MKHFITLKQIRDDCCAICDYRRSCLKGQSRNDECIIGQYIWFLENDGDVDDWRKYYDDLINPMEEDIDDDDSYMEFLRRRGEI